MGTFIPIFVPYRYGNGADFQELVDTLQYYMKTDNVMKGVDLNYKGVLAENHYKAVEHCSKIEPVHITENNMGAWAIGSLIIMVVFGIGSIYTYLSGK